MKKLSANQIKALCAALAIVVFYLSKGKVTVEHAGVVLSGIIAALPITILPASAEPAAPAAEEKAGE